MIIASFAELGLSNLRVKFGCRDYMQAHQALFNDKDVYLTMNKFFTGLINHCNARNRAPPRPSHAIALPQPVPLQAVKHNVSDTIVLANRDRYFVAIDNLVTALIVAQFGTRTHSELGVAHAIELRLVDASIGFANLVRDTLTFCGVAETATFAAIPDPLVDCLRFMFVELNEARKAYLLADRSNRYAITARTLDRLYEIAEDESVPAPDRRVFQDRIEQMRRSVHDMDLLCYDTARKERLSRK